MSTTSVNLGIRIDSDVKRDAENVLSQLGMSMTTAITVFLRQTIREQALPFQPTLQPEFNARTKAALEEARELSKPGKGKVFHSIEELRQDLLS